MNLSIDTQVSGDTRTVAVSGEVDVSCADELRRAVEEALAANPARLEVNLADVGYIDSTGIGVLVGASHRAEEAGCGFEVTHPQKNVRRVLGLLGVERELHVED